MSKFVASVYGTPDPNLSQEDVDEIIARAEANGHNVFFGEGWRKPEVGKPYLMYASQPPVATGWQAITSVLAGWF